MHKLSTFQIAVIGVFIFHTTRSRRFLRHHTVLFKCAEGVGGEAVLWGTLPAEHFRDPLEEMNRTNEGLFKVVYVEKDARTFDDDLVEALASGAARHDPLAAGAYRPACRQGISSAIRKHVGPKFPRTFVEEGSWCRRDPGLPFSVIPS